MKPPIAMIETMYPLEDYSKAQLVMAATVAKVYKSLPLVLVIKPEEEA